MWIQARYASLCCLFCCCFFVLLLFFLFCFLFFQLFSLGIGGRGECEGIEFEVVT